MYNKQTWQNLPNRTTPLTATRLNHIETGIANAHTTLENLDMPMTGVLTDSSAFKAQLTTMFEAKNANNFVVVGLGEPLPNPSELPDGTIVLRLTEAI